MGKKSKKKDKKQKKVSAKKEKYAKFRKEKPTVIDLTPPDLTPEQQKQRQADEASIGKFLRFNRNAPRPEIRDKNKR
ncbi:MAG: hypothetical protein ABIH34_02785 [Nanoarchaeota archaeon]